VSRGRRVATTVLTGVHIDAVLRQATSLPGDVIEGGQALLAPG
jgi:hypothetical protein